MLFFEKGVSATTLEQIADKAGVTRGAIYHHYLNKHQLLEQILSRAVGTLIGIFSDMLAQSSHASIAHLQKTNVDSMRMILDTPSLMHQLSIIMIKCEYTEENIYLIEKQNEYQKEIQHILIAYLEKISLAGTPLSKPALMIADALLCYNNGILTRILKDPASIAAADIGLYMDMFFPSVTAPRSGHKDDHP